MPELVLLRGAKQLLTLRGPRSARRESALRDLSIIEDGSVLIRDGRIVMVGPTRRIENLKEARGASRLSVEDMVVMPGFVDPALNLSLLPDSNGSASQPRPIRIAELAFETTKLARSCLEQGTLTAQAKVNAGTGALRSDDSVLRRLAGLKSPAIQLRRAWRVDPHAASREPAYDYHARFAWFRQKNLAHFVEIEPSLEPPVGCPACADHIWNAAANSRVAVNLPWCGGPASVLSDLLGRAKPASVFLRSSRSPAECEALAASSAIAVFSPNRDLVDSSTGDAARCLAAIGGAIALSSGYDPWRSPNFSMQLALALAVVQLQLTPEEAISAATINAAYAVGVGDLTGSLESGKKADLLVMNVRDYRDIPAYLGINKVLWAMRDGRIVLDNRAASKVRPN